MTVSHSVVAGALGAQAPAQMEAPPSQGGLQRLQVPLVLMGVSVKAAWVATETDPGAEAVAYQKAIAIQPNFALVRRDLGLLQVLLGLLHGIKRGLHVRLIFSPGYCRQRKDSGYDESHSSD